jgi:thiamine kinase
VSVPVVAKVLAGIGRRLDVSGTYREIQAGLTNRSYLVDVEGRPHVLRLDTRHAARMGLDRGLEFEIQRRAAARGIAPPILAAEPDEGWLLYEYLEGRVLTPVDLADQAKIEAIAELLRTVHDLPASGRILSVVDAAARYLAIVRPDSGLSDFARRCVGLVAAAPPPVTVRCCHNDIVAANIVANGRLRLIDWEYACDNDPLFDLASLIGYHDLDERTIAELLAAYAGRGDGEMRERLSVQRRLFDALQWLWLAARQEIAPSDSQLDRLEALKKRIA